MGLIMEENEMQELDRACQYLLNSGIDAALLTSHENVAYASGFDVPLPIGSPNDFSGGYPLGAVFVNAREKYAILIVADTYAGIAEKQSFLSERKVFRFFDHFVKLQPVQNFIDGVQDVLDGAGVSAKTTLGIEYCTLPAVLLDRFTRQGIKIADAAPALEKARSIKTPREIELLAKSAAVTDAGQNYMLDAAKTFGQTEFDLWAGIFGAMSAAAETPAVISGELVTGSRTGVVRYPGGPVTRTVQKGDSGLLDISVRLNGYWCDCCNFVVFGAEPASEQKKYYAASKAAYETAIETIRPGLRACDVFAEMEKAYAKHGMAMPHYGGHQIGTSVNENPRIVPYDTSLIEGGMVFCFEPGAYSGVQGTTGTRLEKMVLVEDGGVKVFNRFSFGLNR
jgi:Xaa-Pro aminopeptidase